MPDGWVRVRVSQDASHLRNRHRDRMWWVQVADLIAPTGASPIGPWYMRLGHVPVYKDHIVTLMPDHVWVAHIEEIE